MYAADMFPWSSIDRDWLIVLPGLTDRAPAKGHDLTPVAEPSLMMNVM
jgi:hypothetical protein